MKRDIEQDLIRWKEQKNRLPLLVRGARQVGKSYIIEKFGDKHFDNYIVLNFEKYPEYKKCFTSLDPVKIVNSIELICKTSIIPGKTLLFLDEIQDCPKAILALRYFKEEMNNLHIIGAGSLLEFVLNGSEYRMPVGRIQFLYLRPLSFGEYLDASGNNRLRTFLKTVRIKDRIEPAIHEKLISLTKEYCSIGGMPAVVSEYLDTKNLLQCQDKQTAILMTFRNDFGKYAKKTPNKYLQNIFIKAPGLIGKWLKYSTLSPDSHLQTIKNALQKLCDAGLIILVYATSAAGLPFVTHRNEKKIKMLFLDVGLVKRACGLELTLLFEKNISLINDGALAEQFVGQELLASRGREEMNSLYSWKREKKSSSAEIDYLISVDSEIIPIEVKSAAIGSLRSLKIFMKEKNSKLGIKISEAPLSLNNDILSIPFYLVEELSRLACEII